MPPVVGLLVVNCEVPFFRLGIPRRVVVGDSTLPALLKGGGGAGGGGGGGFGEPPKHIIRLSVVCYLFCFGNYRLPSGVEMLASRLPSSIFLVLSL